MRMFLPSSQGMTFWFKVQVSSPSDELLQLRFGIKKQRPDQPHRITRLSLNKKWREFLLTAMRIWGMLLVNWIILKQSYTCREKTKLQMPWKNKVTNAVKKQSYKCRDTLISWFSFFISFSSRFNFYVVKCLIF